MNKPAALKKIMSIISVLLLGAGSLGCNGKVFSALLDKDSIPLFAVLALNGGPRVSITSAPAITIANVGTYSVSGTCSVEGQPVTVAVSNGMVTATAAPVCTAGSFTAATWGTPAVSDIPDSQTILITADHVNLKGKAARQARATVVKDTAAPGATISSTAPEPTNLAIPVTITFSEPVTGFEVGDITVGNGTAGSFAGSGRDYTAIITPVGTGVVSVTVDIIAGVALDAVGNPNTAAAQLTRTYNTTDLFVSISSTVSGSTNAAIPITITFSRSVTGFESTEIIVGNGSVSGFSGGSDVAVYTATINPAGEGSVTVDINAGVAQDAMSNANIAADQFSITYDSTPPTVSIESPTDTLINAAQETVFTLTYEVAPTGLDTGDISLTGASAGCSVSIDDATTTTPDVRISGCSGNGSFTIAVAAGTSQDAAGNADLGDSTSGSVTVDNTAPRISSVETAKPDGTYTINEVINIAVEFDEPVTFAGTGATLDVALNSGATLHLPTFTGSSTNINYTVAAGEYTPVTPTALPLDSSGISIAGGGTLTDAAGNAISNFTPISNISAESTIYIDAVLPEITLAETMDDDANGKIDHYKVTFNRNINDSTFVAGQWDVAGYVITGLDTAIAADVDNDTILYIAFTELGGTTGDTGAKPDLTTPGTLTLVDNIRGNPMTPIPDIDDVVETDTAAPVIMKATGQTGATGLSIEFSEQVDANGAAGACPGGDGNDLITGSFVYTDDSGDGANDISSMGSDATACSTSGNYAVSVVLDADLETSDLDVDHVAPALNAIRDMGDNWADSGRQVAVTGAVSPYVYDVYANLKQKIRVAFSEPVNNSAASNAESALNHANYSLAENPVESGCSGTGSDTVNIDTATAIVDVNGDGTVFELTTTAAQCSTTTYELTVNQAIIDQDDGVGLVPPYIMTFLGNEQLRVVSGSNIDIQSMVVVFNKSVEAGTGDGGAELTTRYLFNNIPAGTAPTSAVRGSVPNANRVTLGTSFFQKARTYVVIGANGDDSYGFTEGGVGAIKTTTNVSEGAEIPQESLQAYPRDRAPWVGFGTPILNFDDGPLSVDPFGNPVETFGYLASYGGKVYIGPNALGNTASRMDPDASNPELVYFQFEKDTTGDTGDDGETEQASNDAATRDGGIAVPPYVTIGHTGCTADTADLNTGCGPDNENGRGVFSSGMIGSTEYIFLGGARTTPDGDDYWFDYVYYTSGTGDTLSFNYVDMGSITGTVTSGLSSNLLFNDRLQVGMAKVNESGGDGNNAPDFGKVSFNTADTGDYCTPGSSCDATLGTYGDRYYINRIDYFGGRDQSGGENTHVNRAYIVGVDSLYSFNGRIYAANGGLNYMNRDGGVIRSDGTNYANPGRCDAVDDCPDWLEIAPRSQTEWYNTDQDASGIRFSLELVKLADQIPSDKATPGFTEYEGKLYMIRNTCAVRNANENIQTSPHYITGCTQDTASDPYDYVASEFVNRQPQLWVCTPGTTGDADECDAADWALVDDTTPDGVTNFGDAGNHSITMVMKSGKYLYVGLDNVNGIQVYRVKTVAGVPVANPTEDDFDRIGTASPGIDGTLYKEIYSYISIPGTGIYSNYSFLYVSAGKNSTPVAIFIEMGGNTAAYE